MNSVITEIQKGSFKELARLISLVENEAEGYENILQQLQSKNNTLIIGITGAPGSGKSTLTDAIIHEIVQQNKRVGVLCVDPSSPFNLGALLGDRIRMNEWYSNPNVFIRSLATRGSLGGLHPKIIEITDVMKIAAFDYIIIETVGVGQSEVEIAGLADITIVVIIPEGGDEIQTIKAGVMEIADIFVVNKSDRPGADIFVKNLSAMNAEIPVIKTVAIDRTGIQELMKNIQEQQHKTSGKKVWLLTEKAYQLIQKNRMKGIDKIELKNLIEAETKKPDFNLYNFITAHYVKG